MSPRTLLRNLLVRLTRRISNRLGFDMVYRNYYSPIPQLDDLPATIWNRESSLAGIRVSVAKQLDYLEQLTPFLPEFTPSWIRPPAAAPFI